MMQYVHYFGGGYTLTNLPNGGAENPSPWQTNK